MTAATCICAEQDCPQPPNRPNQPLCRKHYLERQDGAISRCSDCQVTYKSAKYQVCRSCNQKQRGEPENSSVSVVETVRKNIERHRDRCTNHETNTIQYLVIPLLEGLGWDAKNPSEVVREFAPTGKRRYGRHEKVDVALLEGEDPMVFIEVKRLDRDLGDPQYMDQLKKYTRSCSMYGGFAVLTNGRYWQIHEVIQGRLHSNLLNVDILNGSAKSVADQLNRVIGREAAVVARWWAAELPTSEQITDALKDYRGREAQRRPAFTIFSDATIALIAERKPANTAELQSIKGVGPTILRQHGEAILKIVAGRME